MLHIATQSFKIGQRTLAGAMNINVPAGEVHLVQGPNGCGKSLLLDAVIGVHRNRKVRAHINGRPLRGGPYRRWLAGIRRLFQVPTLPKELKVQQILEHFGLNSVSTNDWWFESTSFLLSCGVRFDGAFEIHSFGQQRIIELVIALASGHCCLLDEPFAGLNPSYANQASNLIRRSASLGRAILVIDHSFAQRPDLYNRVYNWNSPNKNQELPRPEENHAGFKEIDLYPSTQDSAVANWFIKYFSIDGRAILQDINIEVPAGSLLLITGANGTGKSTLLRSLGKYRQPWTGISSEIHGGPNPKDILFSPQPPKLIYELTGRENLKLMLGKGRKVARTNYETARSLLDWMGVSPDGLKRRAEVLSGGEAGIIALVGSLLSPAKILLLDEPFESFSSQASNRAMDLLKFITSKGKAIIASSHDFRLTDMAQASQVLDLSKEATITGKRVGQPIS